MQTTLNALSTRKSLNTSEILLTNTSLLINNHKAGQRITTSLDPETPSELRLQ